MIWFKHKGCTSALIAYKWPEPITELRSKDWVFQDGSSPAYGSIRLIVCLDCGTSFAPSSGTLEKIE